MSHYRTTEQQEYASRVSEMLTNPGAPMLLHGAAGLGKTRAFLIPALCWAAANTKRVLISTATTQLVEQLADSKDMALALDAAGHSLAVERYLPQRQFVSPSRATVHGLDASIGEATDEVLLRHGSDVDPAAICITPRCPFAEREPYLLQKARCATADVVVTTHAALLLDWRTGGKLIDLQAFDAIVIDEADRLPVAASLQLDAVVTDGDLFGLKVSVNDDLIAVMTDAIAAVGRALKREADADARDELQRLRANAADILSAATSPEPWRGACRVSGGFAMRVKNPARMLRDFWSRERVLLTSGTLAVYERFDDFKHATGITATHPGSSIIEPKRHGIMTFFLADRSVPSPSSDEPEKVARWLDYVAAGIHEAAEDGDRILVLTTSFDATEGLATRLGGLRLPVVAHQRGERLQPVLGRYSGGVLISPGAWEGVDLGVAWSDIVIPRIPYPPADGVLDIHFLTAQAQAARRMTQGLARGLRDPSHGVRAWLLDPRFPLPAVMINRNEATQQAATHHLRLTEAIPQRFRRGIRSTFDKAEIFRAPVPAT